MQDLSAARLFDKDIFALINVCVRVTARGYDGEAGTADEDKWQGVINACKIRGAQQTQELLLTELQTRNYSLRASNSSTTSSRATSSEN